MNKKEAAEYLGVNERILSRYVQLGRISVTYVPGKNGREARYSKEDLERFHALV